MFIHIIILGERTGKCCSLRDCAEFGASPNRYARPLRQSNVRQPKRRQHFLASSLSLASSTARAAGDRRLDALLVLAVPELHERLVIEAQRGDVVSFRGTHQCGGRRPQCAALRESDSGHPDIASGLRGLVRFREQQIPRHEYDLRASDGTNARRTGVVSASRRATACPESRSACE